VYPGTSFQFFPRGGTILTDFLGGGAKYEEKQILYAKTPKINILQIREMQMPLPAPPPNDVPWSTVYRTLHVEGDLSFASNYKFIIMHYY